MFVCVLLPKKNEKKKSCDKQKKTLKKDMRLILESQGTFCQRSMVTLQKDTRVS